MMGALGFLSGEFATTLLSRVQLNACGNLNACLRSCDTCDKYLHSRCLSTFQNFEGEWKVCNSCFLRFSNAPGLQSVQCDLRSLPPATWKQLHSRFQCQANQTDRSDEAHPENKRADIAKVVELRQTLDCHLDYMIKYVEMGVGQVTPELRTAIVHAVKETLSWKNQPRSHVEVSVKFEELSEFMVKTLRHHGKM